MDEEIPNGKTNLDNRQRHHRQKMLIGWTSPLILLYIFDFLTLSHFIDALKISNMSVPLVADLRHPMELICQFDLGAEDLYAVKLYKDDQEFFRYMPKKSPDVFSFPVAGVHLMLDEVHCNAHLCKVELLRLSRDHSGGAYRCEISSEAPTFKLASETHNVTVAALPIKEPRVEGLAGPYSESDLITANCISDPADPAPILSWLINNNQVTNKHTGEMVSSDPNSQGLIARSLTLRYTVDRKLARQDVIELECVATLPGVPHPPQSVIRTVRTKSDQPQVVNNQKLYWYHSSSISNSGHHRCYVSAILLLVIMLIT